MQTISQLDQDHADIACHRQQHLAEVFSLMLGLALEFQFVEFGESVDQRGDRRAKALDQFVFKNVLIFHDVMQQRGHDGLRVEFPLGADFSHCNRMRDVWVARASNLTEMHLVGEAVGVLDGFQLGWRQILGQAVV